MSMMQPNPGVVSGPSTFSQRTDIPAQGKKDLPNAAYGEQKQFQQDQSGAKMAGSADISEGVIPLGAETRRPNEYVTEGVDAGPGAGRAVLGLPNAVDTTLQDLSMLAKYMPLMAAYADSPQSTGTMKAFVKYLRSQTETQ
jgi:hypothetical protein